MNWCARTGAAVQRCSFEVSQQLVAFGSRASHVWPSALVSLPQSGQPRHTADLNTQFMIASACMHCVHCAQHVHGHGASVAKAQALCVLLRTFASTVAKPCRL